MSVDFGGEILMQLVVEGGDAEILRKLAAATGRSPEGAVLHLIRHSRPPAHPNRNGSGQYEVACSGPCGTTFLSNRRPLKGRRNWCEDCRAAGEPAAQRARDYRARHPHEEQP